ncbi:hypothetical protein [Kribbia dieselivorans]|uniref:hypothetical protein n=1 Tax=Kribbia dieselivorans TaxID=331526 RepID=UPI0008393759|nr:hypothetical protein [Kribbia dieselivorans]
MSHTPDPADTPENQRPDDGVDDPAARLEQELARRGYPMPTPAGGSDIAADTSADPTEPDTEPLTELDPDADE